MAVKSQFSFPGQRCVQTTNSAESASPANAPDLTEEIAVVRLDSAPSNLIGHRGYGQRHTEDHRFR